MMMFPQTPKFFQSFEDSNKINHNATSGPHNMFDPPTMHLPIPTIYMFYFFHRQIAVNQ